MRHLTVHGRLMWRVRTVLGNPGGKVIVQTFDNAKDADAAWVAAIKSAETYEVRMEEFRTIADAIR